MITTAVLPGKDSTVMVSWAELFALIGVLLNVVVVCIMLGEHKHK